MDETVPSELMEVFSVRFLESEHHDLKQMYGCILMSAFPLYDAFNRQRGDPLDIDSKGFIKLKDPCRVIKPSESMRIFPFLFKYDLTNQFGDNKGELMWYLSDKYDTLISRRLGSQFGEAEVNYAVYRDGVAAHVDITLIGCRFPSATPVHGLITARNSKLGEQGKSILFDAGDGEGCSIDASPCKDLIVQLPLLRRKVAVPLGSTLTIGLNIVGASGQQIADVELEFVAKLIGQDAKTFRGAACQISVGVTWSHYPACNS